MLSGYTTLVVLAITLPHQYFWHVSQGWSLHFTVASWSNVGWSWSKWCTLVLGERIAYNHMLHYPISQAPKEKDLVFTVLYMLCLLTHMLDDVMIPKIRIPRELHNSILLYWPCLTIIIYHTMPPPVEIVAWATCNCIVYRYLYLDIFILRCWLSWDLYMAFKVQLFHIPSYHKKKYPLSTWQCLRKPLKFVENWWCLLFQELAVFVAESFPMNWCYCAYIRHRKCWNLLNNVLQWRGSWIGCDRGCKTRYRFSCVGLSAATNPPKADWFCFWCKKTSA